MSRLKAIWANNTPYSKFLLAVGIILMGAVFFTLLATVMATGIFGLSFMQLQTLMENYDNPLAIAVLKLIQIFSSIGTFIIPAFVIAWLFDEHAIGYLKLSKKSTVLSVILVFILLMVSMPLINFLGELNSSMSFPSWLAGIENWMRESEDKAARITEKFLEVNSTGDMIIGLFMIALLPALGEELIFRGVIQRLFSEWSKNVHVGVWSASILFSVMHMQFYGFIPRVLLGGLLGYMLVWSGTLWLPIIAHFINNSAAVIFTYLFKQQLTGIDPDKIGTENDYATLLASLILTGGLLWTIYLREKKVHDKTQSVRIE